jgi:Cyclic nucleotide-binding domain
MERYMMLLKSFKRMPFELEQILRENVRPLTVRKHDIIASYGTVTDNLYFVQKGLFRLFVDKQGTLATLRFKREDEFIISLSEFSANRKLPGAGIEALEDGLLWLLPGALVSRLKSEYHEFRLQLTAIIVKDWISVEDSMYFSHPNGGSANYDRLRESSPDLLDRVPIHYLADYTNIPEKVFRHLHSTKFKLKVSTARRRRR